MEVCGNNALKTRRQLIGHLLSHGELLKTIIKGLVNDKSHDRYTVEQLSLIHISVEVD